MINIKMQPTEVQKLSPKIIVIGVGGAGGNAVNNMISSNLEGCEFLVCNTDAQALNGSSCQNQVQMGPNVTGGLGAGSKPEIGKAAAEESLEEVLQHVEGANMAFVTAGMGGGTGTGAAPIIAKACRERGILTVGVVTKPFHFEGAHRMKSAEAGIDEMQDYVDTLIVIPNQNLFRIANEKTTFAEGFKMADSVLQSGVRGVTDLMVRPGLVNLDFADIRTAMLEMGKAMMGTGEAEGDKRAVEAAEAAINNPLLDDVSMKGAHGVIINVTGGYDMTLFEADEACNRIRDEVDPDANIIFGATFDDSLEGIMRVSIVATGIEKESAQKGGRRDEQGSGDSGTGGPKKVLLERAKPNTGPAQEERSSLATSPASRVLPPVTSGAYRPSANIPSAPSLPETPDTDADTLEQVRFTDMGEGSEAVPHNTAMRGTRYKNSFIPPKPVDPGTGDVEMPARSFHASLPGARTAPSVPAAGTSAGLQLNPPKLPTPGERKRSPSLFERITGTVQNHLEGMMEETGKQKTSSPAPGSAGHEVSSEPAQGQLNMSSPSKPGKDSGPDLDIPAFLRRQAN